MGKSYRIRTTPGVDKNIILPIDQDFEQLEILSLKIRQQDVYNRMCADFGVVVGRIYSNRGYGIPNAKVSIFVPITDEDKNNPIIRSIYPYETLDQTNEDGYRFNLLPYRESYPGHVPTGTFPSREDSVIDETAIEIYDKYYKYTVTTNDSGDYLIFGVPVGAQTVVMNVDLSDIGPFSLSPQDLIRMGVAVEDQFDGTRFKSSPNFNELPQIIVISKTIDVVPFWGEEEICRIGITRTDFDLSAEANINISPTAIFMGSIMSTTEKASLRANGSAQKETGELCKLITGPGEILGISQTIFQDSLGLPVLERANFPNGGKLIDENGTWMFDLPMNRDYVFTNEFGEQVLSDDPEIGVPTKAKYRFKVKWQQSRNINEDFKVGYYLVPNIRERGWQTGNDPADSPGSSDWVDFQKSYGFSLDWSGYTARPVSLSNRDIQNAIDCEDTFYEFDYNKVYTVAGLIDNYKITQARSSLIPGLVYNVNQRERFVGIKRIEDDTCESTTNRYPVNDAVFRATLTFRIFDFLLRILSVIGPILIVVYSIIAFLWNWLKVPFFIFLEAMLIKEGSFWAPQVVYTVVTSSGVGTAINAKAAGFAAFYFLLAFVAIPILFTKLKDWKFGPIRLPMLTYPDCVSCDCDAGGDNGGSNLSTGSDNSLGVSSGAGIILDTTLNAASYFTDYEETMEPIFTGFNKTNCVDVNCSTCAYWVEEDVGYLFKSVSGYDWSKSKKTKAYRIPWGGQNKPNTNQYFITNDLPLNEIINSYNVKSNYYLNQKNSCNSIGVRIEPTINTDPLNVHTDNVLAFLSTSSSEIMTPGALFTFVDPSLSLDTNDVSGATNYLNTRGITGSTNYSTQVTITYADPQSPNQGNFQTVYNLNPTGITKDLVYKYKADIEYFQVLTAMTYSQFLSLVPNNPEQWSFGYILKSGETKVNKLDHYNSSSVGQCGCSAVQLCTDIGGPCVPSTGVVQLLTNGSRWSRNELKVPYKNYLSTDTLIVFMLRGVDPYSPKYETEFSLDRILGYNTGYLSGTQNWVTSFRAPLRLNIPIQNPTNSVSHIVPVHDNFTVNNQLDNISNQYLYYPSYFFTPSQNQFTGFTTTLHRYYSALDYTKQAYRVDPGNSNTEVSVHFNFSSTYGSNNDTFGRNFSCNSSPVNPTQNAFYENNLNSTYDKYNQQDSVAGGTYMYRGFNSFYDGCFVLRVPTPFNSSSNQCLTCTPGAIAVDSIWRLLDSCTGWKDATYFSFIYSSGITPIQFTNTTSERIVMRTDRLPSSSDLNVFATGATFNPAQPNSNGENTGIFAQNQSFAAFQISDEGTFGIKGEVKDAQYGAGGTISGSNAFYGTVFGTFDCDGMVDLDCYRGEGRGFRVDPSCASQDRVERGCYIFVDEPLLGLFKGGKFKNDIVEFGEYILRYRFFYALCQGVFSTVFVNNWVNGNLFMFSFKVDTFYNALNEVSQRVYPKDVIILQEDSNNFYYRSSPMQYLTPNGKNFRFIGSQGGSLDFAQNERNLKYPTTIMNLGPKDDIQKFLNLNDNFEGYNIDKLPQTTYKDLSDMINFMSVIRLLDKNFWDSLFKRNQIEALFSRGNIRRSGRVDGDFAQAASVNSELGVIPFDSEYYASEGPNPSLISVPGDGGRERMMGVYFYSSLDDIQIRDYISPIRKIRFKQSNPQVFLYQNLINKSQIIPNYKWRISSASTIFGTQSNNWLTSLSAIRTGIRYQQLDRTKPPYFRDGDLSSDLYYRGYIHAYAIGPKVLINSPNDLILNETYTISTIENGDIFTNSGALINAPGTSFVYNGTPPTWTNGSRLTYLGKFLESPINANPAIGVGAPWHFYFGVRKGATAINRFFTKYLGIEDFNE